MPELVLRNNEEVDHAEEALSFSTQETDHVPGVDRSSPSQLPIDILKAIFDQLALANPAYAHKPDIILGPSSPWMDHMRFQKGLTLVCRQWWEPATWALYKRVVLRRMGQISAFARTLSSSDSGYDFSTLVKHISLHDCAIIKPYAKIVLGDLRFVLRRCTTVQSLSIVFHTNYGRGVWSWLESALDVQWMSLGSLRGILSETHALHLSHLELPLDTNLRSTGIVELYHILSETPQLLSLRLEPLYYEITPQDAATIAIDLSALPSLPKLSFPALQDLQFSTRCAMFTEWATSSCQFPRLTSLTLLDNDDHIPLTFLKAHGARLKYLHCYPLYTNPASCFPAHRNGTDLVEVDALADISSAIEHLVICAPCPFRALHGTNRILSALIRSTRRLSRLQYLDVWLRVPEFAQERTTQAIESHALYGKASSMKKETSDSHAFRTSVRLLSYHDHSDIPRICHPTALAGKDEIRILYIRDVCIVQTSWCVRPNEDMTGCWRWWPPKRDESRRTDPDYVDVEAGDEGANRFRERSSDYYSGSGYDSDGSDDDAEDEERTSRSPVDPSAGPDAARSGRDSEGKSEAGSEDEDSASQISEDTSAGSDALSGCDSDDWSESEDGSDMWSSQELVLEGPPYQCLRALPERWEGETMNDDVLPAIAHDGPLGDVVSPEAI